MQITSRLKEFPELASVDLGDPDPIVYELHKTLDDFVTNVIPNYNYNINDLISFATSLVNKQNGPGEFVILGGNWSLISIDEAVPSDVRVGLIFFPSYIAVSFLTLFWYRYKERAEAIPGFLEALHNGIYFISARGLFGHGMEANAERTEAVRILVKGRVHKYLLEKQVDSEKCRALYDVLVQFKRDLLRKGESPFEALDLIRELDEFSNLTFRESPYFSWQFGEKRRRIILEAPYTVPPSSEMATKEIVMDVAARTDCSCVIGKVSKNDAEYTRGPCRNNEKVLIAYDKIIKQIVVPNEEYGRIDNQRYKILHLILRGMNDDHGIDIDLSSRNGLSCNTKLTEMIMNKLRWGLQGYSRRTYSITANSLFNGGSQYLDYFRKNRTGESGILAFGTEYNVLEIRLSRFVRSTALGRVKDVLAQFIEEYESCL